MGEVRRTQLGRMWVIKTLVFGVVLLGLAVWGTLDAFWVYPAQGERHARWAKWQYLQAARDAGRLGSASVTDPSAEMRALSERRAEIERSAADKSSVDNASATMRLRLLDWMSALQIVGKLTPEETTIADARATLDALGTEWSAKPVPRKLAKWDIPVQYVFMVVGFGGGAWIFLKFARVRSKVYTWDAETQTLGLPGGATLTPSDIREFDKRRWHKYLVTIAVKDSHPKLAGAQMTLDLYHHTPLEEWVLQMEKTAFPPADPPSETSQSEPHAEKAGAA